MSVHPVHAVPEEARRGHLSPGTGVTYGCGPPYGFWEQTSERERECIFTKPLPQIHQFTSPQIGSSLDEVKAPSVSPLWGLVL